MNLFGSLVVIIVVVQILRGLYGMVQGGNARRNSTALVLQGTDQEPGRAVAESFDLRTRIARWRRLRVHGRKQIDWEIAVSVDSSRSELSVLLPCSRALHTLQIVGPVSLGKVKSIRFELDGQPVEADFTARRSIEKQHHRLELQLFGYPQLDRIVIATEQPDGLSEAGAVAVFDDQEGEEDLVLLRKAIEATELSNPQRARQYLERYEQEATRRNPHVAYRLALLRRDLDDPLGARDSALLLAALGWFEAGLGLNEQLQGLVPWQLEEGELQRLRRLAGQWELSGVHGLLCWKLSQRIGLGFEGFYLREVRQVLEVRRAAAGRRLRSLRFAYDSGRTAILDSHVRIHRADGRIEDLQPDRFGTENAEDDNVFITEDRRSIGHWILPDLERGDLVELRYDLFVRGREARPDQDLFQMHALVDPTVPTLEGRLEIVAPKRWELPWVVRNAEGLAPRVREAGPHQTSRTWTLERYAPRRVAGLPYHDQVLLPHVAIARETADWATVADRLRGTLEPPSPERIEVPSPLREIVDEAPDAAQALAAAFYWVRDHIKYGSLASGNERVKDSDRAERLMEVRTGDCKDKTFLLDLVCRRRGIPAEQVLVASRRGVIVPELPADQFDHVLLRARPGERWLYLDAASETNTMSNLPPILQGLQGLALGREGALVQLPENEPEANRLEIDERLELAADGSLESEAEIRIAGSLARYFDEQWKLFSLMDVSEERALQKALGMILPGAEVIGFERRIDTTSSDRCELRVRCRRGTLAGLEDSRVATCRIHVPTVDVETHREADLGDEYHFSFRQIARWRVRWSGAAAQQLRGVSRLESIETDFARVQQRHRSGPDGELVRELELRERQVRGERREELVGFLRVAEEFQRAVLVFAPRDSEE